MNKRTFLFLLILLTNFIFAEKKIEFKKLTPEPQHPRVVQLVSHILLKNHYKVMQLDDSLSETVYNNYIKMLDRNKSYFIKSDVDEFDNYKDNFDQYLLHGELKPVFMIYNRFQERLVQRLHFVFDRLEKPFDFTKDEYYQPYRDSLNWAENEDTLDEIWRKRLKNEVLSLKLSGKKDEKIKEILHKRYTNFERRLSQTQSEDVIQVYLNALSEAFDPHTSYFSPKAKDDFNIRMRQSLEGIGARLTTEDEYTKAIEIIAGGPADKSGLLKPNDYIIGVGQGTKGELVDVIGWRIDDVVQLIRGKKGTQVRLQILHNATDLLADADVITITRDKVKLEDSAAKSDTLHIENGGKELTLGVIKIPAFYMDYDALRKGDPNYKSTTHDVQKLLKELKKQHVDGLVLDLRNDGGGFLSEAVSLTGLFITQGPVVQVRNTEGQVKIEDDTDPGVDYDGPLVVLVNQFSASASEIFAAAIQDYKRGLIIGTQTYGKGTVQNMADLNRYFPNAKNKYGQIKLTIAKFYRISGGSTQHLGVIPDISLPSRFNHKEVGESSNKNALIWDQINPVPHIEDDLAIEQEVETLKLNHQARMSQNTAYIEYRQKIAEEKKYDHERVFSLNLEKRQAERDKVKSDKTDEKDKDKSKKKKDIELDETAHILGDFIRIENK